MNARIRLAGLAGFLLGAATPFMFLVGYGGSTTNVSAGDAVIAGFGAFILLRLLPWPRPWSILRTLVGPLVLFFAWMAFTSALSFVRYDGVGVQAIRELLKYLADLIWLGVAAAALGNARTRRGFIVAWFLAAVALALGAVAARVAAWPVPVRPELTFENPNALGFYLGASVSAPWWMTRETRSRLAWAAIPLILLGVLASGSRGATLGAVAGLAWMLAMWLRVRGWFSWRRALALSFIGIALIGVVLVSPPAQRMAGRIFGDSHLFMVDDRLELWNDSWVLYQRSPRLGMGPGMFAVQREAEFGRPNKIAHNEYLTALTEQGPLGLVALLYLLGSGLWYAWRYSPKSSVAVVGGGVLIHSAVHGFVSNVFQMRLFWIGFALVLVAVWQERETRAKVEATGTHDGASSKSLVEGRAGESL